jgi:hypothetical protein
MCIYHRRDYRFSSEASIRLGSCATFGQALITLAHQLLRLAKVLITPACALLRAKSEYPRKQPGHALSKPGIASLEIFSKM